MKIKKTKIEVVHRMPSRTNTDKCMFQHNVMKSQNRNDTKNVVKALRENADHVGRNKKQTGVIFFNKAFCTLPSFLLLVAGHSSSTTGTVHCHSLLSLD